MAEEIPIGPGEGDSTPAQNPSDESTDVIASDLFNTDAPSDAPADAYKGTPALFDPSRVDFRRGSINDIPEVLRPHYEGAFKAVSEMNSGITKRDQDLQDQLQKSQQAEQEWRDRVQTMHTIDPSQQQAGELQDRFAQMTPEQQQGVNVVQEMINNANQPLAVLPDQIAQLNEAVVQMQQTTQANLQQQMVEQVAEARTAHGNDIDNWAQQISALVSQVNPLTGMQYSVKESYELLSGKTAVAAGQARQTDQEVRAQQKQALTSPAGTPVVSHEGLGDLSVAEARAGIEGLPGFER